jgi:glutathione S-transferase
VKGCGLRSDLSRSLSVANAQCKEPWYLALNPNGLAPAIDDGGFVMWETAAINLYLAETYKNSLYPSTPQNRGRTFQWTFFATTEVEPALITLFPNRIFSARPAEQDLSRSGGGVELIARHAGQLDRSQRQAFHRERGP